MNYYNNDDEASNDEAYNDMSFERGPNESDEDYEERMTDLENYLEYDD